MPIAAGRHERADLDDLLSNVPAAAARCKLPLSGADAPWRLVSGWAGDDAVPLGMMSSGATTPASAARKTAGRSVRRRGPESWAFGAALEALASMDADPSTKPADVSLRCAAPQLSELIEPLEQPPLAAPSSDGVPVQSATEASGAVHCIGLGASPGGTGGAQPRTAKPPISSAGCREIDPVLARVIEAWPKLPRAIQAAIRTLAETGRMES